MNLAQVFFLDHPKSLGEIRSSETRLGVHACVPALRHETHSHVERSCVAARISQQSASAASSLVSPLQAKVQRHTCCSSCSLEARASVRPTVQSMLMSPLQE